jgi:lipid II:glycine glycyltransferase (peptidoglycan interpeptide bridge formation enzyme)
MTSADQLRVDPAAWDAFVAAAPTGAYPQLSPWAEVKAVNGWAAERVVADAAAGPIGAQLLTHRLGPTPFSVGYAPRGPIAPTFDTEGVRAFTEAVRASARKHRLTHVTIDPEVERGHPLAGLLAGAGWRRGTKVQPDRSRLVDLERPEEAVWGDLRSKWRQYVGKARRAGVVITEGTEADLPAFYEIYRDTARRAGFIHRAASAYSDVYGAYARKGLARLLFARTAGGEPVATLMLLQCGRRVIEPYGGMTVGGAESRANYLLKWEAMRSSREHGAAVYDMWGLAHPGIAQFKAGFGGREVHYIGAWELVTNRPLRAAVLTVQQTRVRIARRGLSTGATTAGDAE